MISKIDICNLALAHLGQMPISSLEQEDEQARRCRLFYEPVRREVLRTHNWQFANTQTKLALVETNLQGMRPEYTYAYPPDCLFLRKVCARSNPDQAVEFEELYRKDIPGRVIVCGAANALAFYTRDVSDTTIFDPAFVKAFSLALAADLAVTLTGDLNLAQRIFQKYSLSLEEARRSNMTENFEIHQAKSTFAESR